MGKNFQKESQQNKQSGCMWGIVHVLHYHQWQSNVKKMIPLRKYQPQRGWSPDTSVHGGEGYEKLLDEEKSPRNPSKKSRSAKKRSLRARFRAMIFEEASVEEDKDSTNSSLHRTYSIHHLESVEDLFGKIRKDWTHPIIFLPRNSEDYSSDAAQTKKAAVNEECDSNSPKDSKVRADFFEIFKVDREMFLKNLQDSDEGIANFPRLKTKGKFSKSRSFPVADMGEGRKLKPLKIESKQKEVWQFPRTSLPVEPKKTAADKSEASESLDNREEDNAVDRIVDNGGGARKHTHRRSSSLSESMDKYARLFENSLGKDVKLSSSKSLKLTSEYGYAPPKFQRIRSLSNADSYYSSTNFEVSGENSSGTNLVLVEKDSSLGLQNSEEEETVPLNAIMEAKEDDGSLEESEFPLMMDALEGVEDRGLVSDPDVSLQNIESPEAEVQLPKGIEQESRIHELVSENLLSYYEMKEKMANSYKKISDLDYVRCLLNESEIATDASEMAWHASDQLLSPRLFEEIEGDWPHEEDELDGYPEFQGCWHHQMLFDMVNEVLLEVYDTSLPYYPKALSSNCHVPPFPTGKNIIEEVCTSIGSLMNVEPEEKQMLDGVVGRDLARDRGWMNLQLESESVALYLEELIFDELVEEVMCS